LSVSICSFAFKAPFARKRDSSSSISAEGSIPRRPGDKTAASYLNFLIVNGGIVLPTFDDPNDDAARTIIAAAFPDREVVTVPGREIVLGGGNMHCITQQQPRG
jgi:agmatine deiminase